MFTLSSILNSWFYHRYSKSIFKKHIFPKFIYPNVTNTRTPYNWIKIAYFWEDLIRHNALRHKIICLEIIWHNTFFIKYSFGMMVLWHNCHLYIKKSSECITTQNSGADRPNLTVALMIYPSSPKAASYGEKLCEIHEHVNFSHGASQCVNSQQKLTGPTRLTYNPKNICLKANIWQNIRSTSK